MAELPLRLMSRADYVRVLRPLVPPEAFAPARRKLVAIAAHTAIIVAGSLAVGWLDTIWQRALLSLVIGHSTACLAFLGHDLSHNSIVRSRRVRYPLELLAWGLRLMPVTLWHRLHNETHHAHSNAPLDCDRQCFPTELTPGIKIPSHFFTPFNNVLRWNPMVGLTFIVYAVSQTIVAVYTGDGQRRSSPRGIRLRRGQRAVVLFELAVVIGLQAGLFALSGFDWAAYLWCSPVPIAISSALTMMYIFTNHFLNPITETPDPLLGTTSVSVPRCVDWLHGHFSYHTEHHLFPSMNSAYYPLVSRLLCERFPERYHRVGLLTAWRRLWTIPLGGRVTPSIVDTMPQPERSNIGIC
jgi:fatty acid desaturase